MTWAEYRQQLAWQRWLNVRWSNVRWSRAYFKESVQLHRHEEVSDLKKLYHLRRSPKISDDLPFYSHFFDLYISAIQKSHPSFKLSHFKIYNNNCTIAILQLKITCYNCRNCHQLHVKICPAVINRNLKRWSNARWSTVRWPKFNVQWSNVRVPN